MRNPPVWRDILIIHRNEYNIIQQKVDNVKKRSRGWRPYIGIELPNKAGEVIVLEELGKEIPRELWLVPDNE